MIEKKNKTKTFLLYAILISYFFGTKHIYIGFAVKPYMIVLVICTLYMIIARKNKLSGINQIEKNFILFMMYIFFTSLFADNISDSFRYICGFVLIYSLYILLKNFISQFKTKDIKKAIFTIGIIYGLATLFYYLLGVITATSLRNGQIYYGLLVDRGSTRLISFASTDPNITAVFLSFFYTAYISHFNKKICKFGAILYFILIMLTLSRGAILSIILVTLIGIFVNQKRSKNFIIKLIISLIVVALGIYFFLEKTSIGLSIMTRFTESDGGSGRIILWTAALNNFIAHPIFGIGINNTINYNIQHHNLDHYIHNTYLEVLSELGFIGTLLYLMFLGSIILTVIRKKKKKNESFGNFCLLFSLAYMFQIFFLSLLLSESLFLILAIIFIYINEGVTNEEKI